MKILIFIFCSFVVLTPVLGSAQEPAPVVAELFSSQNCPACPPADEFMKELSDMEGVIALSCHVDYFGQTSANMGREFCTDRQARYIEAMGRKKYFTPHMVINGHMNEIGYETAKISTALMQAQAKPIGKIIIRQRAAGVYDFDIPATRLSAPADIWMAIYNKPKNINERGRMVTYYNVVKRYIPIGEWNGGAISHAVFPIIDSESAGFAIVAQNQKQAKFI